MLCKGTDFVVLFNVKSKKTMLAENRLRGLWMWKHCQQQSHCHGHQLRKITSSKFCCLCARSPIWPPWASLSALPTTYFMSVRSFIQLIFTELPQGGWQRDSVSYWVGHVTHLTPSVSIPVEECRTRLQSVVASSWWGLLQKSCYLRTKF